MIIKKFQAETETEAIMLAKEELGKDAIVMNIKAIKPKGVYKLFKKSMVEVTAAVDDDVAYTNGEKMLADLQKMRQEQAGTGLVQLQTQSASQTLPPLRSNPNLIVEEDKKSFGREAEDGESAIEQRLNELQNLLEKQMQVKEEQAEPVKEEPKPKEESKSAIYMRLIVEQMVNNEVDEKYAAQIIDEIKSGISEETAVDNVLSSVYQKIILKIGQLKTIEIKEGSPKYIFFIGPTGVGKTTTIAKIASDLKLKKRAKLALVTSDTYRIAAVEQLRTYANILGIPLKVVYTPEEMEGIKEEFAGYDVVLIDTAGRSHQSEVQKEDIKKLLLTVPEEERDTYLVLSATTKYRDLVKITQSYSELAAYNLIFTKLDETDCLGNILNIHMLTGAALSYTTYGQNVPDDIEKLDAQGIAKKLLGGSH